MWRQPYSAGLHLDPPSFQMWFQFLNSQHVLVSLSWQWGAARILKPSMFWPGWICPNDCQVLCELDKTSHSRRAFFLHGRSWRSGNRLGPAGRGQCHRTWSPGSSDPASHCERCCFGEANVMLCKSIRILNINIYFISFYFLWLLLFNIVYYCIFSQLKLSWFMGFGVWLVFYGGIELQLRSL